jgi:hypothetical protein
LSVPFFSVFILFAGLHQQGTVVKSTSLMHPSVQRLHPQRLPLHEIAKEPDGINTVRFFVSRCFHVHKAHKS